MHGSLRPTVWWVPASGRLIRVLCSARVADHLLRFTVLMHAIYFQQPVECSLWRMRTSSFILGNIFFSAEPEGVGCLSMPAWVLKCQWYRPSHVPVGLVHSDHVPQEEHYRVLFGSLRRGVAVGGLTSLTHPMGVISYQYGLARTPL